MFQSQLGIDISKATLDVVLLRETNRISATFQNDEGGFERLVRWMLHHKAGMVHACLESTGQYGDGVAEYLYQAGIAVSVVNPARIKRYGDSKLHRNKTDKADAALIAEFCRKETPLLWAPLLPHLKQLRQLVRRLDNLQTNIHQEQNRLKSGTIDPLVVSDLKNHVEYLQKSMTLIKNAMRQVVVENPELKKQLDLLMTIPGIGELTATRLLSEIGDISNFDDAPQLAAYAGLNPKAHRSGSSVFKKTRISKEGRAFLRRILYMPAITARRFNPIIRLFCDRLSQRNLPKMAIIAASMRKLLHLVFGVLKHQMPFDCNYLHHPTSTS